MKQFVMYGAGSIGRGFIGSLFSKIGYEVTFIDVNDEVIRLINQKKGYNQIIVGDTPKVCHIDHVKAVDGKDEQAVCQAIAQADLMATALGANVLPKVAPLIAKGLEYRWQERGDEPLDILICENLMDADHILHGYVKEHISDSNKMDLLVGFIETSIGKMVPPADNFTEKVDPLDVRQEAYEYLPVNSETLKTKLPECPNIIPYTPFNYYVKRKLYIHNMAHLTCAYLGMLEGYTYISESASNTSIQWILKKCMEESSIALALEYNTNYRDLQLHMNDLLYRFANKELKDTVARVARDPMRKLQASDRLIGSVRLCLAQDVQPIYLAFATALALYHVEDKSVDDVLKDVCLIRENEEVYQWIRKNLKLLKEGLSLEEIISSLQKFEHEINGSIL